ncbi:MAG: hypothetical protein JW795_12110 [Chitinivibrionales bacterium]|nr:hypothetical protein [Chitinivibrionales bacterium]
MNITPLYRRVVLFCLCVCVEMIVAAPGNDKKFVQLSGRLPTVIANIKKPYLVTSQVEVPRGQKTSVEKGVVFLFKNFSGITINGTFQVMGTKDQPVIFTSENDSLFNPIATLEPAPYDWDGITVNMSDSVSVFDNCVVKYSLFGIHSLTKTIVLRYCNFSQNGKNDFSIDGKEQDKITENYSYVPQRLRKVYEVETALPPAAPEQEENATATTIPQGSPDSVTPGAGASVTMTTPGTPRDEESSKKQTADLPTKPADTGKEVSKVVPQKSDSSKKSKEELVALAEKEKRGGGVPEVKTKLPPPPKVILMNKQKDPSLNWPAMRWVGLTLAVASCAAGGYETPEFLRAKRTYDKVHNSQGMDPSFTSDIWERSYKRMVKERNLLFLGIAGAGVGLLTFSLSF